MHESKCKPEFPPCYARRICLPDPETAAGIAGSDQKRKRRGDVRVLSCSFDWLACLDKNLKENYFHSFSLSNTFFQPTFFSNVFPGMATNRFDLPCTRATSRNTTWASVTTAAVIISILLKFPPPPFLAVERPLWERVGRRGFVELVSARKTMLKNDRINYQYRA